MSVKKHYHSGSLLATKKSKKKPHLMFRWVIWCYGFQESKKVGPEAFGINITPS